MQKDRRRGRREKLTARIAKRAAKIAKEGGK
jgi:hypothetical protein